MNLDISVTLLSALAHPGRLSLFRLLAAKGIEGACAGDIAAELGIGPTTASGQLSQLCQCGLIEAERDGRRILYRICPETFRALLGFLTRDCCDGHPELCLTLAPAETFNSRTRPEACV